jgi:hypothetical protein
MRTYSTVVLISTVVSLLGTSCQSPNSPKSELAGTAPENALNGSPLTSACPNLSGDYRLTSATKIGKAFSVFQEACGSIELNILCDEEAYSGYSPEMEMNAYPDNRGGCSPDYANLTEVIQISGKETPVNWSNPTVSTRLDQIANASFSSDVLNVSETIHSASQDGTKQSDNLKIYQSQTPCGRVGSGATYLVTEANYSVPPSDPNQPLCQFWEKIETAPAVPSVQHFSPLAGGAYKTSTGAQFTQVVGPGQFGLSWKDPSGAIWSSYQGDYGNDMGESTLSPAASACAKIGGQLPSYGDYARLLGYFELVGDGYPPQDELSDRGKKDWNTIFPDMLTAAGYFWTSSLCMFDNEGYCNEPSGAPVAVNSINGSPQDETSTYSPVIESHSSFSVRCIDTSH